MGYDPTEDYGAGLGKTWSYETQRLYDIANGNNSKAGVISWIVIFWLIPLGFLIYNIIRQ